MPPHPNRTLAPQVARSSPTAVRRSMRALQNVHVKHLGPLVEGRVARLDSKAFLRDCQRGEAALAARLWRSMVTTESEKSANWKAKFLGSTVLLGGVFRAARGHEAVSRSPAGLLFGHCLELHSASRHVMRLAAASHLMPYPDKVDTETDRQNAARERAWASCLDLPTGRAARMAKSGLWEPALLEAPKEAPRKEAPSKEAPSPAPPAGAGAHTPAASGAPSSSARGSAAVCPAAFHCLAGHELQRQVARGRDAPQTADGTAGQLTCDGSCGQPIGRGAVKYCCATCDFDLCEARAPSPFATPPPFHPIFAPSPLVAPLPPTAESVVGTAPAKPDAVVTASRWM